MSTDPNTLAELALIADDESYFTNTELNPTTPGNIPGAAPVYFSAPLAPLIDTDPTAPQFLVANPGLTAGYTVVDEGVQTDVGAKYIVFDNPSTNNVILAFGGTDGTDATDWKNNLFNWGYKEWTALKVQVFASLNQFVGSDGLLTQTVTFTGQSLGGALAQYALYDWLLAHPTTASQINLITYNGLGGVYALQQQFPAGGNTPYNPSVFNGLHSAANFTVIGDIVSQLGGGFVTGDVFQINYNSTATNPLTGMPYGQTLGPISSHRIESGFYANLPSGGFTSPGLPITEIPVSVYDNPANGDILPTDQLQNATALIGDILNGKNPSTGSNTADLLAGLAVALSFGNASNPSQYITTQTQLYGLTQAVWTSLYNSSSGILGKATYTALKALTLPETLGLKAVAAAAAPITLLAAGLSDLFSLGKEGVQTAFSDVKKFLNLDSNTAPPPPTSVAPDEYAMKMEVYLSSISGSFTNQTPLEKEFEALPGIVTDSDALAQQLLTADSLTWRTVLESQFRNNLATNQLFQTVELADGFDQTMKLVPQLDSTTVATLDQERDSQILQTAEGIANTFSGITLYPNVPFVPSESLTFPVMQQIIEGFKAELANTTISAAARVDANQAMAVIEQAAEVPVIQTGSSNPFEGPGVEEGVGFDPGTAPPASVNLTQNGGQTLTLSLPYAAGQGGEKIALQLQGNEANDFVFLTSEGEFTPDANGIVNITVPEGEQQYTFNLLANNDAKTNSSLTLSATPLDQNGQAAGTTRLEATIQLTTTSQTNDFPTLSYPIVNGVTSVPGFGGFGADTDFPGGSINGIVDGTGNVNYTIVAPAAEWDLETAAGNDSITGSNTQSFIGSGGGNDTVYGGDGGNLIVGDYIDDGSAPSSRTGAIPDGQDYLVGGAGSDLIGGGGGNDVLLGGGGNDNLIGDAMVETQYGIANTVGVLHSGNDFLDGGAGNDTLSGNGGDDTLFGGTGDDILYGDTHPQVNAQLLYPQAPGNDFLDGGSGNDSLAGGGGNDTILGGDGNDVIDGDAGNDVLVGGPGSDIYRFQIGDGQDTIIDTAPAGEINTIMFEAGITGLTFTPDPVAHTLVIGYDTVGDTVTLKNFDPNGLFGTSVIQNIIVGDWNPGNPFVEQNVPNGPFVPVGQTFSLASLLPPIDGFVDGTNANNAFTNNTITTGPTADFIEGGPGGMTLDAGAGNDTVEGGSGNDTIHGGSGNNQLFGGEGDDLIYGEGANDTIDGGAGNDTLIGTGGGTYTYLFGSGSGHDVVDGSQGGTCLIQLSGNLNSSDVTFGQSGSDLIMTLPGGQDSLTLKSINGNASLVDFPDGSTTLLSGQNAIPIPTTTTTLIAQNANGTTLNGDALGDLIIGGPGLDVLNGGSGNDVILGGVGDDVISGLNGNDVLLGGAGNDYIDGNGGFPAGASDNDYLDGGPGNDFLTDGFGSNTYVFAWGDGHDVIQNRNDHDSPGQGQDTLKLVDILPGDITIQQYNFDNSYPLRFGDTNDLEILVNGTSDSLLLNAWIDQRDSDKVYDPTYIISQIQFADGTTWSATDLLAHAQGVSLRGTDSDDDLEGTVFNDSLVGGGGDDYLTGSKGNDTLDGGAGNDTLEGGLGSDTYVFGKGYGSDSIYEDLYWRPNWGIPKPDETDVIRLNADVTPGEVTLQADTDGDLVLRITGTQDSLTVNSFFQDIADQVEQISFTDGTLWDLNAILAKATGMQITGTESNDVLTGTPLGDVISGLGGADTLDGAGGNDLLIGGTGDDTYLFRIGSGQATIEDTATANELNRVRFDSGVSASDLVVSQSPGVLTLALDGTADQIQLMGFDPTGVSGSLVAGILDFTSGFQISTAGLVSAPPYTDGADSITGTANNAVLLGGAGDDTLDGGLGNDTLIGGPGNDTYRFNLGDGVDSIDDRRTEQNRLVFGAGITPDQIHLQVQGSTLTLQVGDTGDAVKIAGFNIFDSTGPLGINQFQFADGTAETSAQLLAGGFDILGTDGNDTVSGTPFDDRLIGEKGNDLLIGNAGADTYVFNIGDGHDTIDDYNFSNLSSQGNTIEFGSGISGSDLTFLRDGFDLLIRVGTNGDAISLQYFGLGYQTVQTLDFADGTSIDITNILNTPLGTTASETITGTAGNDVIFGGGGNDALYGGAGNDTLVGGSGYTQFYGGAGNNVFIGGSGGNTYIIDPNSSINTIVLPNTNVPGTTNTVAFASGYDTFNPYLGVGSLDIHYGTTGGELIIEGFDPNNAEMNPGIDFFQFTDRTLTYVQLLALGFDLSATASGQVVNGTSVTDRISGLQGNDTLNGGAGNDILTGGPGDMLIGGSGEDTYVFNLGDGIDAIEDTATVGEGNRIQFGAGIIQADLTFTRDEATRTLTIQVGSGGTDQLRLTNFDPTGVNGSLVVSTLQFADGNTVNLAELFPQNQAPTVVNPLADQTVPEDALFSIQIPANTFVDPDAGDSLTYSATQADGTALPAWLTFDTATQTFSGTPDDAQVGTFDLKVTATDTGNLSVSDDFTLTVTNVNEAPTVANPLANQIVLEDSPLSLTVPANTFADPDAGDILTYSASIANGDALPTWLSFDPTTHTFSGTPDDAQVGTLNLAVKGTDSGGLSATDTVALTIQNVNDAPTVATSIADQTAAEDDPFSFTIPNNTFADEDVIHGDVLSYSVAGAHGDPLPTWLNFDTMTRTFSGTPGPGDAGSLQIVVTATDTGSLSASNQFALVISGPLPKTLVGTTGNDVLIGGRGDDTLSGLAGNDTLQGGAGNDLLDGGTGADTMLGGTGNDTYVVDNVGDVVTENLNEGTDTVQSSITYTLGANIENLTLTGTAAINGTGNALDNVLLGNSSNNTLTGGAGNDRLDGGLGSDSMIGGTGDDVYVVNQVGDVVAENLNEGTDTVESSINYILGSNLENLTLTGTANLAGTGNSLNNVMIGNSGANAMDGGSGNDSLDGGSGNDSLLGGSGDDTLLGGLGDDVLSAGSGDDVLYGDDGNDSLDGGSGDDQLFGGAGNDMLTGGSGADQFTGGTGNDVLTGGSGNDVYNFFRGDGQDTIIDSDPFSKNQDRALFGATIDPLDLVITRQANDLRLAIHGSSDQITIQDWYGGTRNQIETLQAGNGQTLLNTQVDQLIQAMATFSQQTGLTWDQAIDQRPQDVQAVLAASWQ